MIDPLLVIHRTGCNILGIDKEVSKNNRKLIVTFNEVVISTIDDSASPILIPLRRITNVAMKAQSLKMDKSHSKGGLPHLTILYIVDEESRSPQHNIRKAKSLTLWTTLAVWKLDYIIRNAVQKALIRTYDLISDNQVFKRHPFLETSQILTLDQILSLLSTLDSSVLSNPLAKNRFWDCTIRKSLLENLDQFYSNIVDYCDQFSSEPHKLQLVPEVETIEKKISRIKATPFIYKRFRIDTTDILATKPKSPPSKKNIEDQLEMFGNILMVLNAFLCDITFNEKGFDTWILEKTNPFRLLHILIFLSNLGTPEMATFYNLSPKSKLILEHIQMRGSKFLWSVYCITRHSNPEIKAQFKKRVLSDLLLKQPGMLQSCLYLVMHWLGIFSQRMEYQESLGGSILIEAQGTSSKKNSIVSATLSTTTISAPTRKLSLPTRKLSLPTRKLSLPSGKDLSIMSSSLSAKVYRACMILVLVFQSNETGFKEGFAEEIKYILRNFLTHIKYNTNDPFQCDKIPHSSIFNNETRMSNWIFSVLEKLV